MQFYFRQFSGDEHVMSMDLDAIGAHILLMCAAGASKFGHKLPCEDGLLRSLVRNPSFDVWERIKMQLLRGAWNVSDDGKWWVQTGMKRSMQKRKEFIKKQVANANARWHKSEQSHGNAMALPRHHSGNALQSLSSSSSLKHLKPGAKQPHRSKSPEEQKRNVEAKQNRVAQESAVAVTAYAGTNPDPTTVGAPIKAEALIRIEARNHKMPQEMSESQREAERLRQLRELREKHPELAENKEPPTEPYAPSYDS